MDKTTRDLLVPVGVLLLVVVGLSTLIGGMMGPGFMGPGMMTRSPVQPGGMQGWMWGFGMGLGGLMMLAFWGVLIVGGVALFRALGGRLGDRSQGTPFDVLKRRYAAGEITRDQYEQMRKDLE